MAEIPASSSTRRILGGEAASDDAMAFYGKRKRRDPFSAIP
jgi:hypothetical protein